VQEVNEELEASPELVNQDPYGRGWLTLVALSVWEADRANLLPAEAYLEVMRRQAEEAAQKL
jgi:glycine cleavage system H protein